MNNREKPITLLVADDDPDDRMLTREALAENQFSSGLRFVEDGEELLDYLYQRGRYSSPADAPRPDLILLDLNMPKMDGREALREIKADAALRRIPVVVLTTSQADEDIYRVYDLGVNSFIIKPVSFDALVKIVCALATYWFEVVELPVA